MPITAPVEQPYSYAGETELIDTFRRLFLEHDEFRFMSFRVQRDDGDFTNFSLTRAPDEESPNAQ